MGEILYDLEQALKSKKEKIRPEEENFFRACKSEASHFFKYAALAAGGFTFSATGRLSLLSRIGLSGGAAALFGLWRFSRHLDSCVDNILALNGDRMQFELANIILTKYRHDPWRMQLISKHFFSEEVFDDTNPDQPKLLWRYRTFFNDVIRGQSAHESDSPNYSKSTANSNSHGDSHENHTNSYNKMHSDSRNDSGSKRTNFESKQVPENPGIDVMANPFDCVFGNLYTREEIHLPNASSMPPGTHTRGHKRSHRRRRMRHQDIPLYSQHLGEAREER